MKTSTERQHTNTVDRHHNIESVHKRRWPKLASEGDPSFLSELLWHLQENFVFSLSTAQETEDMRKIPKTELVVFRWEDWRKLGVHDNVGEVEEEEENHQELES